MFTGSFPILKSLPNSPPKGIVQVLSLSAFLSSSSLLSPDSTTPSPSYADVMLGRINAQIYRTNTISIRTLKIIWLLIDFFLFEHKKHWEPKANLNMISSFPVLSAFSVMQAYQRLIILGIGVDRRHECDQDKNR